MMIRLCLSITFVSLCIPGLSATGTHKDIRYYSNDGGDAGDSSDRKDLGYCDVHYCYDKSRQCRKYIIMILDC